MRPLPRVLAAALVLGALALPALAQGGVGLSLRAIPASREVAPGGEATTELEVRNDGVAAVDLTLTWEATNLSVSLNRTNVTVPPGSAVRVLATVAAGSLPPGGHNVTFRATDRPALGVPASVTTLFTLFVQELGGSARGNGTAVPPPDAGGDAPREPPPADARNGTGSGAANATNDTAGADPTSNGTGEPGADDAATSSTDAAQPPPEEAPVNATAPVLAPADQEVVVPRGEQRGFALELRNPAPGAQVIDLTLRLPMGWTGTLDATRVELEGGGRRLVQGTLTPFSDAQDALAFVEARASGGSASATLRLRVEPGQAAEPPQDATPPDPSPDADPLPRDPPPQPPPEGEITLRVEPVQARVAPGGTVLLRLVVANGRSTTLSTPVQLLLPPGFVAEADPLPVEVPPRTESRAFLLVRADASLAHGHEAPASAGIPGVAPAPFRLLVEAPPPEGPLAPQRSAPAWLPAALLAAAGSVALAAAWAWRHRHAALVALYARLNPGRLLEHPTRRAIRDLVHREPGIRLADLQRNLGLANGRLRHHVDRLEAAGMLRSVPEGPHRRLYPPALARAVAPVPGLAERIVRAVEEAGPTPAPALAQRLGVSRQSLHYHVKRLRAEGRIGATMVGHELVLAPGESRLRP